MPKAEQERHWLITKPRIIDILYHLYELCEKEPFIKQKYTGYELWIDY